MRLERARLQYEKLLSSSNHAISDRTPTSTRRHNLGKDVEEKCCTCLELQEPPLDTRSSNIWYHESCMKGGPLFSDEQAAGCGLKKVATPRINYIKRHNVDEISDRRIVELNNPVFETPVGCILSSREIHSAVSTPVRRTVLSVDDKGDGIAESSKLEPTRRGYSRNNNMDEYRYADFADCEYKTSSASADEKSSLIVSLQVIGSPINAS